MRRFVVAGLLGCAAVAMTASASAQEIQLTGPLAGAPAVRKLRLHRAGRFEIAPGVSFTLLDQYQRNIIPGAKATFHPTDWLGLGVWGGFGIQYSTGLTDELQDKAVDGRHCKANPGSKECRLTEVNLTRGNLADDQLGKINWIVAPQVTLVPFRGKIALFSSLFLDTDVNFFLGPAFVGLHERMPCGRDDDNKTLPNQCSGSYKTEGRLAVAPTFGLGLNFYPSQFLGFGAEWRGLPFSWNTSGFDNKGGGTDEEFPDNAVNGKDREFHFNSMLTVYLTVALPTQIKTSE